MLPMDLNTVIVALVSGMVGGLLNVAYCYVKLQQPIIPAKTLMTMIIGGVAGIILVFSTMTTLDWFPLFMLGITGGYFGIDVLDYFIKNPIPPKDGNKI